ncbi:hypothetical protein MLD38_026774 [Melastoma candidum]|uniref:Uncharacterized protein n=1 Tax=Melastoma candidum TaxID=119954 RepID=A0ACB9NZN9_9MYRT|nr:hypothetical protein MLD38_026774 [Melastoma candidum]
MEEADVKGLGLGSGSGYASAYARSAIDSLGRGFDLTSDFRLGFAKDRLVHFAERGESDLFVPGAGVVPGVPVDVRCDKGDRIRFRSDVLQFSQMSELLNQKASLQGKVPSGFFNAIFEMSGDWSLDATDTKLLALDGYFISLYYLHLTSSHLELQDRIKKSIPPRWDPASLARFIHSYGTHVIIGMAVGGQDIVCVRQRPSSPISTADLRKNLQDLGDVLFLDGKSPPLLQNSHRDANHKMLEVFNRVLQLNTIQLSSITETSSKDGLTITCSKRGGDVFLHDHLKWLQTVSAKPEAILFKFLPITSLLTGVPGNGYLSHAINLYMRYKPVPEELQHFLEFQVPCQWSPMFCELPLRHHRRRSSYPSLRFCFMGPKIHISSTQVTSSEKPVVGIRLYLEGKKSDRLALHLQHLSCPPQVMVSSSVSIPPRWRGSDELESGKHFFEPVRWKSYSKVCTAPVEYNPSWLQQEDAPTGGNGGVFIVTGGQLLAKGNRPKTALHLRLLFSHIPNCTIRKTAWDCPPEEKQRSHFFTNLSTTFTFTQRTAAQKEKPANDVLNSGVYPEGPPVPVRRMKLLKYVDTAEVVRGPHDAPGHWLMIGAKLVIYRGKIGLHAKFALLDYPDS